MNHIACPATRRAKSVLPFFGQFSISTPSNVRMRPFVALLAPCVAIAFATTALADTAQLHNTGSAAVAEVVVTATRYPTTLEAVLADVTVITQEELRASNPTSVMDVLRKVPGLALSNNGGPAQTTSVFIRGAESRHTLFMVDGQRIGPLDGFSQFQFNIVPVENIERIEVLRGPGSALYGSDAIGGVVHIITKGAQPKAHQNAELTVGVGTENTKQLGLSGQIGTETANWRFSAVRQLSDGVSAQTNNTERDGHQISSGTVHANYQISDRTQFQFNALGTDYINRYDGFDPNPFNTGTQTILGAQVLHRYAGGQTSTFRVGAADDRSNFPGSFGTFSSKSTQHQLALEYLMPLVDGNVLLAYEYLDARYQASSFEPIVNDNQAHSIVLGVNQKFGKWASQLNVRGDANSSYDDPITGHLALRYAFNDAFELGGAVGTGFKAPSFSQISGNVNSSAVGFTGPNPLRINTDLKPEESINWELFINHQGTLGNTRFTVYRNEVESLVVARTVSPGNTRFENQNGQSEINGFTLAHAVQFDAFNAGASLDINSARDARGNRLARRPIQQLKLHTGYAFHSKWHAGAEVLAQSERLDPVFGQANPNTLGGFGVVNAFIEHRINQHQSIHLRLDNIGNKSYEVAGGYAVPQSTAMLTYRHRFD